VFAGKYENSFMECEWAPVSQEEDWCDYHRIRSRRCLFPGN